jgi:hypothetical protein
VVLAFGDRELVDEVALARRFVRGLDALGGEIRTTRGALARFAGPRRPERAGLGLEPHRALGRGFGPQPPRRHPVVLDGRVRNGSALDGEAEPVVQVAVRQADDRVGARAVADQFVDAAVAPEFVERLAVGDREVVRGLACSA